MLIKARFYVNTPHSNHPDFNKIAKMTISYKNLGPWGFIG